MRTATQIKTFLFAFVLLLTGLARADWVPIRLSIDNVNVGDLNVNVDEKGKLISVKGDQLLNMIGSYLKDDKSESLTKSMAEDRTLSIANLENLGFTANYNDKELTMVLVIPLEMRSVKDFPLLMTKTSSGLDLEQKPYSGYLNISGLGSYTTHVTPQNSIDQKSPIEGQFELVQNFNIFTLESTEHYTEFQQKPWQRQDTSIVHDFEDEQFRARLGDFTTGVQGFQNSLSAGGLQFEKQFGIYPDRHSYNRRSTTIQVKTNSLLEVYVNNNLIVRTRVGVGPYNLKNLPLLYGSNKVRVVLQDDFGGREEFEVDMLFDDQILAQGVHDFNYQVGAPSYYDLNNEKQYYHDNMVSMYHKYGVTDNTTLFVNYQNYQSSNLMGLGGGFLTPLGTHYIDLATYTDSTVSKSNAERWRFTTPEFSAGGLKQFRFLGGAEFRSKDFRTITATLPSVSLFSEKYDAILQKQLTDSSSFSIGFSKSYGQNLGPDELTQSFTYQTQFVKNWRLDATYNWNPNLTTDQNQILVTLNWIEPEGRAQAALAHNTVDNQTSMRVTKNSRYNYNDVQLDMFGSKSKSNATGEQSQDVELSANYYATKYEVRAQGIGTSAGSSMGTSGLIGLGTAFAWTTDSFSISRPIPDSFAAIEPEGLGRKQYLTIPNGIEKDKLAISNNENFVFANLTSYVDRPIQLDSTGLGNATRLTREAYIVHPKYRSGVFIPLKVSKSLTLRGKLASDKPEEVNYAYGKIYTADGKIFSNNFFTDESGNFVIDGLSYGKYEIQLADKRIKRISFELTDTGEAERAEKAGELEDSEASEFEMGTIKIEKESGT
ncbi:MAG: fimbria/pilus outer membrane usher protein [Pseudobdellovibrio sp.]